MIQVISPSDCSAALEALRRGEVVAIPTETVYGLAGDATKSATVTQIFTVKERPFFDPLIVHVPLSWATLPTLAEKGIIGGTAANSPQKNLWEQIITRFWPGPLTLLLPRGPNIPDLVTSGSSWVAVRVPSHPLTQTLLESLQLPLAAPSANRFGRISPTTAAHVAEELGDKIPYVLDGGPCEVGVESTIAALFSNEKIHLLRPGKITAAELTAVTGLPCSDASKPTEKIVLAPGQLPMHYAPLTPVHIYRPGQTFHMPQGSLAVLYFSDEAQKLFLNQFSFSSPPVAERTLSARGDGAEAAHHLFSRLRELDACQTANILVIGADVRHGLWPAIWNRLERAAAKDYNNQQ